MKSLSHSLINTLITVWIMYYVPCLSCKTKNPVCILVKSGKRELWKQTVIVTDKQHSAEQSNGVNMTRSIWMAILYWMVCFPNPIPWDAQPIKTNCPLMGEGAGVERWGQWPCGPQAFIYTLSSIEQWLYFTSTQSFNCSFWRQGN